MADPYTSQSAPVKFLEGTRSDQALPGKQTYIVMTRPSGSDAPLQIYPGNFEDVRQIITETEEKIRHLIVLLVETIKAQKTLIDYNGFYTAYLLEQLSEDEFKEEAKKFAIDFDDRPDLDRLSQEIDTLLSVTTLSFTTHELAHIFQCTEEPVSKALESLSAQGLIEDRNGN